MTAAGTTREGLAVAVSMERFADCGPGRWWYVHHPDGYLIEVGAEAPAVSLAGEINAGRAALRARAAEVRDA